MFLPKQCLSFIGILSLLGSNTPASEASNIWTDILKCVSSLSNDTVAQSSSNGSDVRNGTRTGNRHEDRAFSMMKLLSIICGDKDGFVRCLETSLKDNQDSLAQMVGSHFNPTMVAQAYDGLCANISAIEDGGVDATDCLSKVKMTSCQSEMADYFFYMSVVKKFAPPSEQLPRNTLETLLCSMTFQRRKCEVEALRMCSASLADVMDAFYTQTQPEACAKIEKADDFLEENKI